MKAMVGTLLASAMLLAAQGSDTLARALDRVVRAAPEEFKPLRGARIDMRPGRESWFEARLNLPGASCRVYEHPRPTYRCRWERGPERRDLRAFQSSLVSDVEAALGEGWRREAAGASVRFTRERDGTTVEVGPPSGSGVEMTATAGARKSPTEAC